MARSGYLIEGQFRTPHHTIPYTDGGQKTSWNYCIMKVFSWMKSNEFWMKRVVGEWSAWTVSGNGQNAGRAALISYYSLFFYAIRTSISVFVAAHKKHISATRTTTTGTCNFSGLNWLGLELGVRSSELGATELCLLSARKSVYF